MKKTLYYIVVAIVAAACLATSLQSCKSVKMRDGDDTYARGEYYNAAGLYRKLYNKYKKKEDRPVRGEAAFKMGLCYRKLNQSSRAVGAFQNALRYEYPDSTALLYLAQAQHMEGLWAAAEKNYKAYLELVPGDWQAKQGLRACRMAPKWREQGSRYIVKSAKLFNSRRADYCPMFLDVNADQLYFTSSNEKATGTVKSEITGTKNSDIFFSKKNDKGKWQRPEPAEGELNTEFDEGITSFTPDGSTMYLAKAIRKADAPTGVSIYTSQRSEAKWSAPTPFEITADTLSSYGDPCVSPDGVWLYFTSDMPGGQGGLDLWRINIKDKRGTLENLGDQINTPGDERFPYMRTDSILYFASNGHAGFGGLDIFKATMQPSGRWFIENMGSPVNSSGDDFGITFGKGESGFFSSNRKDGRGYDHIYSFEKPDLKVWISGTVLDKDEEPVPNATIRIVGNDGSNQKQAVKPDGTFRFDLQRGVSYVMLASASGYLNARQEFTSDSAEEDAEYGVDFVLAAMHKPQVVENIFYDFDKASLRPASKKALDELVKTLKDNPYITIELSAHTDRVGTDAYNNKLSYRRAKSVVDYLIAHGVDSLRLKPAGYGKTRPKVVTKRIHRLYPQFPLGDTLTVAYIDTLSKANQAAADQINRRTEFQVLSTNFQPFADDLKKMQELEAARHEAEQQAKIEAEQAGIAKARAEAQEKARAQAQAKAAAEKKKRDDAMKAARQEAASEKTEKKAKQQAKRDKEKAKRDKKRAEAQAKREKERLKAQEKRDKEKAKREAQKLKEQEKRAKHEAEQEAKRKAKQEKEAQKKAETRNGDDKPARSVRGK
ncbi:MAG: OmpA family protein [Bacteroidales bacterium]|nr:OmpA family protein [Bacteroidales bacterium]